MGFCTKPTFEAHVPCPLATFDAFPALLSMCKRLSVVILFFLLHGGAWYVLWLMCCLNLAGWMCVKPRNCIRAASVIHLHLLKKPSLVVLSKREVPRGKRGSVSAKKVRRLLRANRIKLRCCLVRLGLAGLIHNSFSPSTFNAFWCNDAMCTGNAGAGSQINHISLQRSRNASLSVWSLSESRKCCICFFDLNYVHCVSSSVVLWSLFSPCKGYPGEGPFCFGSANVTSLGKNVKSVVAICADETTPDFMCLQETRLHPLKSKNLVSKLRTQGFTVLIGPQPVIKRTVSRLHAPCRRQTHGGLAILARNTVALQPLLIPQDFGLEKAAQACTCTAGSFTCRIINVYLPSGQRHVSKRSEIMTQVFLFAASLGDGPTFICGDFNSSPSANQAISEAIRTGEWVDVIAGEYAAANLPPPFTFQRGKGRRRCMSRIDYVLANSDGCTFFKKSWIQQKSGLPDHCPVGLHLVIPSTVDKAFTIPSSSRRIFPPKPSCLDQWAQIYSVSLPRKWQKVPNP